MNLGDNISIRVILVGALLASLLLAVACGGGSSPQPVPTPHPSPSASPTPSPTATPTPSPTPSPSPAFEYHGTTHVSWWNDQYASNAGTTSRTALADTGMTWAGVLATWYQDTVTSTSIHATSGTPSDAGVVQAITELHSRNLKVMLKPHVDVSDGSWRGNIRPPDASLDAWFSSYQTFILHYAQVAEDNAVEMLCIGTEYKAMTAGGASAIPNREQRWTNLITAIKSVYHGTLTYAANASSLGDEYTAIPFWDQLDLIGLDGYFSLTNASQSGNAATLQQLISAWTLNWRSERVLEGLQSFHSAHPGKPVIFTEIGYRSTLSGDYNPWDYSVSSPINNTVQRNCYEAAYEVWSTQNSWLKGIFWWAWPVDASDPGDYMPGGKPAEQVIRAWVLPQA